MSRFASVLLPLDGSPEAARGARCALWLADALGATLHVVHATAHPLSASDELARLRISHAQGARVVVHQLQGDADAAVLEEIESHRIDLVVMSARGETASADPRGAQRLGTIAQAVLERSPVAVVLLPRRYQQTFPWRSMMVAASGEAAADRALGAAARLATALQLTVTVVHAEDGPSRTRAAPLGASYSDALHHEYPKRLEQLVERGLADCSAEQAQCVQAVLLRRGEPASVLLADAARLGSSVLALGWHGSLEAGRANVFKRLLEEAECALLVVRGPERSRARLKVGSEMDEDEPGAPP
jgi:nucleotide-binding universal stress UspA family protein